MMRRTRIGLGMACVVGMVLAFAACAGTPKKAEKPGDDWELAGWRVIGCCCPSPCPCRLDKKPTNCHGCDHTDVVHVDRGSLHDVKMDGVTWVLVGRGFGENKDGNWVYCYVDDRANDQQVGALQQMLGDTVKAWGARAPYLAGKFIGLRKVPMTVKAEGEMHGYGVTIPGILEIETRAIYNPGHKAPVISTGIMDSFGDRFVHADAVVHKLHDPTIGYQWDLTGRQANQTAFVLNQKRIDEGGIGWGCWSAHADFGDHEKYGEQLIQHE